MHWYAKALEAVGTVDDTDAVVKYLENSQYDGVLAQIPLLFDYRHRVSNVATEVCLVEPNSSDKFTVRSSSRPPSLRPEMMTAEDMVLAPWWVSPGQVRAARLPR